jgi:hypothetical protein
MGSPRALVYGLLLTVAVASAAGRLFSTQRVSEPILPSKWPAERPRPMPTFGSNDRSRWATIRALVDDGTYVIGRRDQTVFFGSSTLPLGLIDPLQVAVAAQAGYFYRTNNDSGIIFEDGWQSVDKALHPAKLEFYSTKPPLLATILAGLYWLLQFLFGWTLRDEPFAVVRTILVLVNLVPFYFYLRALAGLAERFGRTDWSRYFVLASAAFGTLVTPFLITLNNHTLGTFAVLFTLLAVLRIWEHSPIARGGLGEAGSPPLWLFAAAGLLAAFAVVNELPALSFAAAVFCLLAFWHPWRTLLVFVPAAALVAAAFFVTNYLAIGQLKPAYAEFGGPWYEYEGSHWRPPPPGHTRTGIDWAWMRESRGEYALHVLVGHHGLFSLTPLWILSLLTMVAGTLYFKRNCCVPAPDVNADGSQFNTQLNTLPWFVPPLTLALTVVVVGFYLVKSDNYGGNTSGLRWLMWLTPLWLLCLLPVADRLAASPRGRCLGLVLLGISIFSVHYAPWNPWRPPWLYDLMLALGWKGYDAP